MEPQSLQRTFEKIMQFLIFSVLLHALCASAAPYLITSYLELSVYTRTGTTRTGITTRSESLITYTEEVQLPATVTAAPAAITTYTTADSYYTHVSVVNVVLSKGVGETIPYATYKTDTETINSYYTTYMVPVTYHAPASCAATSWDFVATVSVYVPPPVRTLITPATITTTVSTYSVAHLNPSPTTRVYVILDPKDVDVDDLSSASSSYATQNPRITRCTSPTSSSALATSTGSSGSSSGSTSSSSGYYSGYYSDDGWYRTYLIIAIAIPVGWTVLFLFLGLLESFISFKGLMLGQQRKRGLPYSWCCIIVWTLCFTGPTYKARSVEEQAVLKEKWAEMGFGTKLKLWFKWGFRWKYPVDLLGAEPEVSKRAFRQGCL